MFWRSLCFASVALLAGCSRANVAPAAATVPVPTTAVAPASDAPPVDDSESCQSNADCGAKQVCTHPGGRCGKNGELGKCLDRPHVCPAFAGARRYPTCGCDGKVYVDQCDALRRGVDILVDRGCVASPATPVPPRDG
jgi:hypothetical protein